MLAKVQKWGNSLGLRIPKSFAEEVVIREGSSVDISVVEGQLVVRPTMHPTYELQVLLADVTEKNLHREISTGEPQGVEGW